ncbi:MAG: 3-isopropylmalate dehydrogenase [Oligoflexales bacterium]|nr:3-isopropylmalate dehydrogenase [Oligoflexales bacterium]
MYRIAVLPGDGIGPEVMASALKVLKHVMGQENQAFEVLEAPIGGEAYDAYQNHFPASTKQVCEQADAILLGSIGGPANERHLPKWDRCEANALLGLRKAFNFYANIRPARVYAPLKYACPLKDEIIGNGVDLVIVRELLGDLYFGKHETKSSDRGAIAIDEAVYDEQQIRAICRIALETAANRTGKLTSIDKANVLDTSKLWRKIVSEEAEKYPDVALSHLLVDNAAMQLVIKPDQFDVLLCPNMFGDILSDLASVLPGSLGMVPSASFNDKRKGLYEPAGGSAPDIAGKGIANPCAQILCVAMMLRHSFKMEKEAKLIETSLEKCFEQGFVTGDLSRGGKSLSTSEFTDKVIAQINETDAR